MRSPRTSPAILVTFCLLALPPCLAAPADPDPPTAAEHARAALEADLPALAPQGEPVFEQVALHEAPPALPLPGAERIVATGRATFIAGSDELRAFDRATGALVSRTPVGHLPFAGARSDGLLDAGDGRLVWILESDGSVRATAVQLWDVSDPAAPEFLWHRTERRQLASDTPRVAALPAADAIAIGHPGRHGRLEILDVRTGRVLSRFTGLAVDALAASTGPGPSLLAVRLVSAGAPELLLLDVSDPERPLLRGRAPLEHRIGGLAVDRDGRVVVVQTVGASGTRAYEVRDGADATLASRIEVPADGLGRGLLLASGRRGPVLALAGEAGIGLWDLADPRRPVAVGTLPVQPFRKSLLSNRPWAASVSAPVLWALDDERHALLAIDVDTAQVVDSWAEPRHVLRHVHVAAESGADALAVSAYFTERCCTAPGAVHHLRAVPGVSVEEISVHDTSQPKEIRALAGAGPGYVVAYDPEDDLLLAIDAATGRRVGALHPGAPEATSAPSYRPGLPVDGDRLLVARTGGTLVDGGPGSCVFVIEVGPDGLVESERRCFGPELGWVRWTAFGPGDTLVAISSRGFVVLGADGRTAFLPIDEPHPYGRDGFFEGDVSPDRRRVLLGPSSEFSAIDGDPLRFVIVGLSDPFAPRILASSSRTLHGRARFVDRGRRVIATELPPDAPAWTAFVPRVFDGYTAEPVSASGPEIGMSFHHGPGIAFGDGLFAFWHWNFIGWSVVVVGWRDDPPGLVGSGPFLPGAPRFVRRAGTREAVMLVALHPLGSQDRTNLWTIGTDGTFVPHGHVDATEIASLGAGFYALASTREGVRVTIVRDPAVQRKPGTPTDPAGHEQAACPVGEHWLASR